MSHISEIKSLETMNSNDQYEFYGLNVYKDKKMKRQIKHFTKNESSLVNG